MYKNKYFIALCVLLFTVFSCNILQQYGTMQNPTVSVENTKITRLSFDEINLVTKLKIDNPNAININLAGLDYRLDIDNQQILDGIINNNIEINALGNSFVNVPYTLNYKEIFKTIGKVITEDELQYHIKTGLKFTIPVLGDVRVPIEYDNSVPIPKIPTIRVSDLKLDDISLLGAKVSLFVEVNNPNAFAINLDGLNVGFDVNRRNWVSTTLADNERVAKKGKTEFHIPISLEFMEMGRTVYDLLTGNDAIKFDLTGKLDFSPVHDLIPPQSVGFNQTREIMLTK